MTKKDYIKIADILKRHWEEAGETKKPTVYIGNLINDFARILEADNPRFDRQRFIDYINKPRKSTRLQEKMEREQKEYDQLTCKHEWGNDESCFKCGYGKTHNAWD